MRPTGIGSYAFWWLRTDGIWQVEADGAMTSRASNSDPTVTELRRKCARGGFKQELYDRMRAEPAFAETLAEEILSRYVQPLLHGPIRNYFELLKDEVLSFQRAVLGAYGNRCAVSKVCAIGRSTSLGLEVVPIRWREHGGLLKADNGIVLATHLAQAFLLGGFTIVTQGGKYRTLASKRAWNLEQSAAAQPVRSGELLMIPASPELAPSSDSLEWHRHHVFMG